MAFSSTADLLDMLLRLHLLEPPQVSELPRQPPADPKDLARDLVRRGWLTPYQANQLAQGRGPDLLLGSYVLLEKVGEGGMGAVFKVRNWKLGRVVALKLIRKDRLENATAAARFQREIRAAAQLDHPNIVRALDADEVAGTHLLVMEYIDGIDLAKLVKQSGPLPVAAACEHVRQAALGLQHAHERGMVHRDVKPHNLLLARSSPERATSPDRAASPDRKGGDNPQPLPHGRGSDGVVKILDMGLARLSRSADDESSSLTATDVVMGTPDYIAPEQALQSHTVDARADVYSLGCTLYYLLAGKVPFPGGTFAEKLMHHQMLEPARLEALRPEVPAGLADVVRKMMAKKPDDRFQTAAEVAAVLAAGLAGAWPVPAITGESSATLGGWSALDGGATSLNAPARRHAQLQRLAVQIAAGAGVLLVLVGLLVYALRTGKKPAAPPPAGPVAVEVAADRPWQDTGIDVAEGDRITLVSTGLWRKGQAACPCRGLEKEPRDRAVLPEAPLLCLLTRVGDDPAPLAATMGVQTLTPERTGRLFLQANDLDLEGNSGGLAVKIEGGRAGDPVPAPGPTPVQAADADLRPLLEQFAAGRSPEELRGRLVAFRGRYAGTPQAMRANVLVGEVLARLPSPPDALSPTAIPAEDRFAWQPKELVAVLGEHRGRHWNWIRAVAFSPDGKRLASADEDGFIRLWDPATLRETAVLRAHAGGVYALAFGPAGSNLLASGGHGDGTVRLWDLSGAEPRESQVLRTPGHIVHSVAFSPDGKLLAAANYQQPIRLWDLSGGEAKDRGSLAGHTQLVRSVAFSPDGKTLASGSNDKTVRLWDVTLAAPKERIALESVHPVSTVAFSPDGKLLACGEYYGDAWGGELRLWDLNGPTPPARRDLKVEGSLGITSLAFAPTGKMIVSAHVGGTARLWDPSGAKAPVVLTGRHRWSAAAAISPDGKSLVLGGDDGVLRLWDLAGPKPIAASAPQGHFGTVQSVAFSPDGRLLASAGQDCLTRLWDLTGTGAKERVALRGHEEPITSVAFAPDGSTVASNSGNVRIWEATGASSEPLAALLPEGQLATALAYFPDGRSVATGHAGGRVDLWSLGTVRPKPRDSNRGNRVAARPVLSLAVSPDGKTVLFCDGGSTIERWDLSAAKPRERPALRVKGEAVQSLAFAPDGKAVYFAGPDGLVRSLDLAAAKENEVHAGHTVRVTGLAVSPDGKTLASCSLPGSVIVFDLASKQKRVWELPGAVHGVAFSPEGRHLATANGNGTVYVLRLAPPAKRTP